MIFSESPYSVFFYPLHSHLEAPCPLILFLISPESLQSLFESWFCLLGCLSLPCTAGLPGYALRSFNNSHLKTPLCHVLSRLFSLIVDTHFPLVKHLQSPWKWRLEAYFLLFENVLPLCIPSIFSVPRERNRGLETLSSPQTKKKATCTSFHDENHAALEVLFPYLCHTLSGLCLFVLATQARLSHTCRLDKLFILIR